MAFFAAIPEVLAGVGEAGAAAGAGEAGLAAAGDAAASGGRLSNFLNGLSLPSLPSSGKRQQQNSDNMNTVGMF